MNSYFTPGKEARGITVYLPPDVSMEDVQSGKVQLHFELAGMCGCGGELKRRGPFEWRCVNDRWWHRLVGKAHAHIVAEMQQGFFQRCLGPDTRVKK